MTNKQLNEVAQTPTSSLQEMSQAEQAEVDNLVDQLYTQRLVTNGSALLASDASNVRVARRRVCRSGQASNQGRHRRHWQHC